MDAKTIDRALTTRIIAFSLLVFGGLACLAMGVFLVLAGVAGAADGETLVITTKAGKITATGIGAVAIYL